MRETVVGMATKTAFAVLLLCFVQGLSADTLLKRDSTPTDSGSTQNEPEETNQQDLPEESNLKILQAENSDILAKLQENKQEFYNKINELAANLTELEEQESEHPETLQDNTQELTDKINEIAVNLTNLKQRNSELLNKLQEDKQRFEDKIKEIVSQQGNVDKINITIPLEGDSESLVKLKQFKQRLVNKIDKLKSEAQQKIQELKDKIQDQEQEGVRKRDVSNPLAGGSVIGILLNIPTSLASKFQQKFSEFEEDANEVFQYFLASLGGSLDTLENLQNIVNGSVLANVTNIKEVTSAASSCFEAQKDTVESLAKQTVSQIENSFGADRKKIEATINHVKEIGEKVQDLVTQTARNATQCLISLDCITRLGAYILPIIYDISKEIASEAANLQSFKEDVLPVVSNTASSIVQSALSQAADIAQDIVKCLKDKISADDSTSTAQ